MTWNDFLIETMNFTVSSDILENLEFPPDFRYQIREISREECSDCEYTGKVQFEIVDTVDDFVVCIFNVYYMDGDLGWININSDCNPVRRDFMLSELSSIIQTAVMKQVNHQLKINFTI